MTPFAHDLDQARAGRLPRMALRRGGGDLDDVVVEQLDSIHIERLSADELWIGCYFTGSPRLTFTVRADAVLEFDTVEEPPKWVDIDGEGRAEM
jgi:hypothetical protein